MNKTGQLIFIFLILIFADCAKVGYPEGGERDNDPPVVVEADPGNYSLRFDRKRIEVTFNEFIQLNNINQELVVSPPLEEQPVVRLRNKTMIVDLNSDLYENTTYTFNFGQSIADFREGNILENYEFVFSTGDYLDSLAIAGSIKYAFNHELPEDPISIMLYDRLGDSMPYLEIPIYVGKSNSKGLYRVNNLKADTFRLFALKDANNNFLYDIPEEEIAFLDTLLLLDPGLFDSLDLELPVTRQDSIMNDTTLMPDELTDTTAVSDSVVLSDSAILMSANPYTVLIDLELFREDNKPQYLLDYMRPVKEYFRLIFNRPLSKQVEVVPVSFQPDSGWFVVERYRVNDTVGFWITDSTIYKMDTLLIKFNYEITDSVMNYISHTDTLRLIPEQASTAGRQRREGRKEGEEEVPGLSVNFSVSAGGKQHLNSRLSMVSEQPVREIDTSKIRFTYSEDTLRFRQDYSIKKDSFHLRKYFITTKWAEDVAYQVFMAPGAIASIYDKSNDTIQLSFRTHAMDEYGKIILTLENLEHPLLVQILTEKEDLVRESAIEQDGQLVFEFLEPRTYKMKVIFDRNGNGKWDTGDYLDGQQPERVLYYNNLIEVRADWDKEIIWDLLR